MVLKASTPPPAKSKWHNPDRSSRGEWSEIFEAITAWFCSSHDFNKEDDILIYVEEYAIHLCGQKIRYLGPSLRSAASLVHKAYLKTSQLSDKKTSVESTPGIYLSYRHSAPELPQPFHKIGGGKKSKGEVPQKGTIFYGEKPFTYIAPARRADQTLIWYLQQRDYK